MKIISFANQKGGVGKTTCSTHISYFLSVNGYKTLLMDMDSQGNATSIFLKLKEDSKNQNSYLILKDKTPAKDMILPTQFENLYLIPSVLNIAEIDNILAGTVDGFFRLSDSLESLIDFDYVILDCPPNLGMITINALMSSDYVIIPLVSSKFSLDGIKIILDTIQTLNTKFKKDIKVLGALLNMFDEKTLISRTILEELKKYIYVFSNYISRSVVIEESHLMKQPLGTYSKNSKVSQQFQNLVKEILNGIEKK